MKLIPYLNEQYDSLRQGMKNYLAGYDHHGDDWRMAEVSRLLDFLRHVQQVTINVIYPEIVSVDSIQPQLEKARVDHEIIETILETILNVHVDEPRHEYYEKINNLRDVVESLYEQDRQILAAYTQHVEKGRQEEIDGHFNEMVMRQTSVIPLV